jgi:hypothetical protein
MTPLRKNKEKGQANTEFIISLPILIMLIGGIFLAGFYAWRSAAANWGVYISGVAGSSYDQSAITMVQQSIWWPDIRKAIQVTPKGQTVQSEITIETPFSFLGIPLVESQSGGATFHLWRFVAGPQGSAP